ncbi:MAG: hypothetical protein ACO1SX_22475, partial [Actinomycetota bacterium]
MVTVDLNGDHGPVRVTGTLEATPGGRLDFGSGTAGWNEVQALLSVFQPAEGFPAGSYRLALVTDDAAPLQTQSSGLVSGLYSAQATGTRRVLRLPEGSITVSGEPYGKLTFPVTRIVQFQQEPIRGDVKALPAGNVKLELFPGATVTVPLSQVQLLRRNLQDNTAMVTLADDQSFSGKLLELPKVNVTFTGEQAPAPIPLARVVVLDRRTGGGRRL